jgi:hypothetical protein
MMATKTALFGCVVLAMGVLAPASAHTVIFGPKAYTIASGRQATTTDALTIAGACQTNAVYTLTVTNGNADGSGRVSSGRIEINGTEIVAQSDFNQQVASVERAIALTAGTNSIAVTLTGGSADGAVTVSIRRHIEVRQSLFAKQYTAASSQTAFDESFAATALADAFSIVVRSGDTAGAAPIKSAVVTLNGNKIIGTNDWQPGVTVVDRVVTLAATNQLHIDVDGAGQLSVDVVRHVSDTAGPAITVNFAGGAVGTSPLALGGTVSDLSGVATFTVSGTSVPLTNGAFATNVALNPGANHILLAAVDCEGNNSTKDVLVYLDAQPPQVSIATPADNAILLANSVTVTGTATDDVMVAGVTVNGQAATLTGSTYSATITLPKDALNSSEGSRQITVVATDEAGHQMTATRNVVIDLTPPTIVASAPTGWQNRTVTVAFTCGDIGSGIQTCPDTVTVTREGANQQITGTATDRAGRTATATATVNIDLTPPALMLSAVPSAVVKNATLAIAGQASDALSGVRSVICNGLPATVNGNDFSCSVALNAGTNAVIVSAVDQAGNQSSRTLTTKLDMQPPDLTIDAPADGTVTNNANATVSGQASDDDSIASLTVGGQSVTPSGGLYQATVPLTDGANRIAVVATDRAGNSSTATVNVTRFTIPTVTITSPRDLAIIGASSATITGEVSSGVASVAVNDAPAALSGTTFRADVPLVQGRTVVTAVATSATGHTATSSIHLYRDSIPPRIIVYSPAESATVTTPSVDVTGMVDDIVVGTVNAGQVSVTVNGAPATVSNRAFVASNVALAVGPNTILLQATDQGGNIASATLHVTYDASVTHARIVPISGNGQQAAIGTALPQPIVARLYDATGAPAANRAVRFTVTRNNGLLATSSAPATQARSMTVTTNAQGDAAALWTLGTHAGAGNNRVDVTADGFGTVTFDATGTPGTPALVVVDSGTNQFGATGQKLPRPLIVDVVDRGSNRLANVPVTFAVVQGDGNVDGQQSVTLNTDSDGRAWVTPTLGPNANAANVVTASVAGVVSPAVFSAIGRVAGDAGQTQVSGVVVDNTNIPIAGVTVRIEGTSLTTQTNVQGQFALKPVPVGYVRLIADGSTAQRTGIWPSLEFAMYTISGVDNTIGMPIYLLPIDVTRGVQVSETTGGTLTFPELPGFSMKIAPGSALFPGGSRAGTVSVTLVHLDRMPMTPIMGAQPRFLITIQPHGVHFDPPAAISFPNVDGLAPGEITEVYSFDHDLNQFVAIGTGSVSADGTVLASDPGVGIIKGGWHSAGNPPAPGTCDACNAPGSKGAGCMMSNGTKCVPNPAKQGQSCADDGNACTEEICDNGTCKHVAIEVNLDDANRYVNRDDPTSDWSDAEDLPAGTPVYASDAVGDFVSWKVVTKTLRVGATGYQWVAKGPATYNGPNAPEWRIDGINWKPGFYTIECTVTFGNGCKITRKHGQTVGVRTNDEIVVGWINGSNVPLDPTNVTAGVLTLFPIDGMSYLTPQSLKLLTFAYLGSIAFGNQFRPFSTTDILNAEERRYIVNWQFKYGSNVQPPGAFYNEGDLQAYESLETNYKLFNRLQVRYLVQNDAFVSVVPIRQEVQVGVTIDPIFGLPVPGRAWPGTNGKYVVLASEVHQINDGTPEKQAVDDFNSLLAPLQWNNIGSKIRFSVADYDNADVKNQVYPTYHIYKNKALVQTRPQAAEPSANFTLTPYPPGPPFPPYVVIP